MSSEFAVKNKALFDQVLTKVNSYCDAGNLALPKDYSPGNAIRAAQLAISEVVDRNKKPALEVCTPVSVSQALLDTLIQGLNPGKKQCYYIVYGNKLVMQRSYFGEIHVAKSCNPEIEDIYSDVVYKGDKFEYSKLCGRTVIKTHVSNLENINSGNIIAAYCSIFYKDGHEESTIMTIDEIRAAWKMSKQSPFDENGNIKASSTHGKFPAEMAKKTVTRRACKMIINSSDDSNLLVRSIRNTDDTLNDCEVDEIIEENANIVDVDINEPEPVVDAETGEVVEAAASDNMPY